MNLADLTPHPDLTVTGFFAIAAIIAVATLVIVYTFGLEVAAPDSRAYRISSRIGAVAGVVLAIGVVGIILTGLGAQVGASKAANDRFHQDLQATYGATTDATLRDAQREIALPVRTARGNELVTFRETGGQLVAFRGNGTELPRG